MVAYLYNMIQDRSKVNDGSFVCYQYKFVRLIVSLKGCLLASGFLSSARRSRLGIWRWLGMICSPSIVISDSVALLGSGEDGGDVSEYLVTQGVVNKGVCCAFMVVGCFRNGVVGDASLTVTWSWGSTFRIMITGAEARSALFFLPAFSEDVILSLGVGRTFIHEKKNMLAGSRNSWEFWFFFLFQRISFVHHHYWE